MTRHTTMTRNRRGFTMIEIMAVVTVLGALAALVIPTFGSLTDEAARAAFVADIKGYSSASSLFYAQNARWPEDSSSGAIPTGFESYIDPVKWHKGTPIGGVWDFENASFGYGSSFGVHFNGTGATQDDTYMSEVDGLFDGGDLTTGGFREIEDNSRYYYVNAF